MSEIPLRRATYKVPAPPGDQDCSVLMLHLPTPAQVEGILWLVVEVWYERSIL